MVHCTLHALTRRYMQDPIYVCADTRVDSWFIIAATEPETDNTHENFSFRCRILPKIGTTAVEL